VIRPILAGFQAIKAVEGLFLRRFRCFDRLISRQSWSSGWCAPHLRQPLIALRCQPEQADDALNTLFSGRIFRPTRRLENDSRQRSIVVLPARRTLKAAINTDILSGDFAWI
jgi:hypothetical protein